MAVFFGSLDNDILNIVKKLNPLVQTKQGKVNVNNLKESIPVCLHDHLKRLPSIFDKGEKQFVIVLFTLGERNFEDAVKEVQGCASGWVWVSPKDQITSLSQQLFVRNEKV